MLFGKENGDCVKTGQRLGKSDTGEVERGGSYSRYIYQSWDELRQD